MLRHGQLPFWNQYIFSGTPLMADFNAGAFHPLIGLFVVMPDRAAWLATEVIAFSLIAIGMYVFLRALRHRRRRPASSAPPRSPSPGRC